MGGGYFDKHTMMVVVVKLVLGSIFYLYNVVVYNTYFTYTKMGARIHRTVALRCDCDCIQFKNSSAWKIFAGDIFDFNHLHTHHQFDNLLLGVYS